MCTCGATTSCWFFSFNFRPSLLDGITMHLHLVRIKMFLMFGLRGENVFRSPFSCSCCCWTEKGSCSRVWKGAFFVRTHTCMHEGGASTRCLRLALATTQHMLLFRQDVRNGKTFFTQASSFAMRSIAVRTSRKQGCFWLALTLTSLLPTSPELQMARMWGGEWEKCWKMRMLHSILANNGNCEFDPPYYIKALCSAL